MGRQDEHHGERWPALPLPEWQETCATLHMWTQVVGKVRLALAPPENHWWQVPLYVTARGLTTSPIPYHDCIFQIDFDFIDHRLEIRRSDGRGVSLSLAPRPVAEFYRQLMESLLALDIEVAIRTTPVEVPDPVPFEADRGHAAYDPDYAHRFWRILAETDRLFKQFRGRFLGKASPVHFFWGSFDLAVTRFSGRTAPPHPGAPNVPDLVTREAYSHEVSSCGFWPGTGLGEPAFYAYAYPEPEGFANYPVRPAQAYYHPELREYLLPYEAVRTAISPDDALLAFLQSTYEAAAELGRWNRHELERSPSEPTALAMEPTY